MDVQDGGRDRMKMAWFCIFCELCTTVGILYALVRGAGLREVLGGVLLLLLAVLLYIRAKERI